MQPNHIHPKQQASFWLSYLFVGWMLSSTALAQAHLEKNREFGTPVGIGTDAEFKQYRNLFDPVFQKDCLLNVVILPSQEPETALALRKRADGYELLCLTFETSQWRQAVIDARAGLGAHARLKTYARPLMDQPSSQLLSVWKLMVSSAEKSDRSGGVDGVSYWFGYRPATGKLITAGITNPDSGSKTESITQLAEKLKFYTLNKASEADLQNSLDTTLKEIQAAGSVPDT